MRILRVNNNSESNESIMKWFHDGIGEGENGIVIYPNLRTFRQIYTRYVKEQLEKRDEEDYPNITHRRNKQLMSRIILIATFTKQLTA